MHEQSVTTDTGRFHCAFAGPDDAPAVLYLHGFPDHPRTSAPCLEIIAAAGYRVIAPWLRGYAPSVTAGPYALEQLVDDLLSLARVLSPGRQVHLLGHDWGAVIDYSAMMRAPDVFASAVALAVPHPVAWLRSLARTRAQIARSWYMLFFQMPRLPERVIRARDMAFIDHLWRAWSPDYTLPADQRRVLHQCLGASMPAPIEYYRAVLRPVREARWRVQEAARQPISVPTLQLQGERDGCIGPECARGQERWFAGPFAAGIVPGVGHFMQQEAPADMAGRVLAWYARHPASARPGQPGPG